MTEDTDRAPSSLFQGKQFWLSQNIPQRSRFKELITNHGGIVRLQERDADVKLVDHTKKNLPADTYSYKYIEDSIRHGKLANLESHRVGPSAHRPVGATYIPTRGKKILYSLQDDQALWDWVQQYEGVPGYPISGNKIYQDLAANNPRHTYQSYRDRYLKRLRGKPRPGGMEGSSVQKAPEAPPAQTPQEEVRQKSQHPETRASTEGGNTTAASSSISKDRSHPEEQAERSPSKDTTEEREVTADIPEPARQRTPTHAEDAQTSPQKDARKRKRLSNSSSTAHRSSPPASETAAPKRRRYPEEPKEPKEPEEPEEPGEPTDQATISNRKEQIETNDPEVDGLLRQLPFWPSSPAPESEPDEATSDQADERTREKSNPVPDIDEWIDDCIRTGKAHSDKQVIEALRCTTMDPDLAQTVLQHLVAGKAIPDNIPGVWTAEDDEHLEGGNARYIERVLEKHGDQYVESRGEYLGLARATGLAGTDD